MQVEESITGVFVYGSLMRGESNSHLVWRHQPTRCLLAECVGLELFDLGPYPAAYPAKRESGPAFEQLEFANWLSQEPTDASQISLRGEYVEVPDLDELLMDLDALEEYDPLNPWESEYVRIPVKVNLGRGRTTNAYIYVSPKPPTTPRVASNDWRAHRCRRERILAQLARKHMGQIPDWESHRGSDQILLDQTITEWQLAEKSGLWCVSVCDSSETGM